MVLGNHDFFDEVIKHFNVLLNEGQNELYYSNENPFFKSIYLDSSKGVLSSNQLNWLKNELSTTKKIILYIHHPIFGVDLEVDRKFHLQERTKIQELLINFKEEVNIFCGHYHMSDYQSIKNIKQYITPGVSFQVEKDKDEIKVHNRTFGYRIIEINEKEIKTKLVMFKTSN